MRLCAAVYVGSDYTRIRVLDMAIARVRIEIEAEFECHGDVDEDDAIFRRILVNGVEWGERDLLDKFGQKVTSDILHVLEMQIEDWYDE